MKKEIEKVTNEEVLKINEENYEVNYRKDSWISFLHFEDNDDKKVINLTGLVDIDIAKEIFTSDENLIHEDIFTYNFYSPTGYLEFPVSSHIVGEMGGCSCGYYKQIYVRTEGGKSYYLEISPSSEAFYILTSIDNDMDEVEFTVKVKNVPLNEVPSVIDIFSDLVAEEEWDY
ncbi:hypothetical protein [Planococcus donghaensis]|uniref:hypothetical protein n=1 Tax=Planococcus donghaensis TaxID=414778 RepID=UPI003736E8CB